MRRILAERFGRRNAGGGKRPSLCPGIPACRLRWAAVFWLALCVIATAVLFLQKTEVIRTESYGLETDRTITLSAKTKLQADFTLTGASFQGLSVKFQADAAFQTEILTARLYDGETGELLAEAEAELQYEIIRNKDYGSTIWFSLPVPDAGGRAVRVIFMLEAESAETELKLVLSDTCSLESSLYLDGEPQEGNLVFSTRYSLGEQWDSGILLKGAAAALAGVLVCLLLGTGLFFREGTGSEKAGKMFGAGAAESETLSGVQGVKAGKVSGAGVAESETLSGVQGVKAGKMSGAGTAESETLSRHARRKLWCGLAVSVAGLCTLFVLVFRYYVQTSMEELSGELGDLSFLPKLYLPLCAFLLLFAVLHYRNCFWARTGLIRIFFLSGLFLGTAITLVICLNTVPDEPTHIDSAYQLSNEILGIPDSPKPGYLYKRACDVDSTAEEKKSLSVTSYQILYQTLFEGTGGAEELVECAASNNFSNCGRLFYLPQALGLCVGRLLHWGTTATYLLARFCALLTYLLLTCAALRAMPFAKTSLALIALLPISLQQAASFSYDSVLNALAFVFVADNLKLAYDEDGAKAGNLIRSAVCGWLIASAKGGVYLPLAFLAVLAVVHRGKQFRKLLLLPVIPVLSFFARNLSSTLSRLTAAQGSLTGGAASTEIYTLGYLLHRPFRLAGITLNTFYRQADSYLRNLLGGNLAWREVNINWCVVFGFILVLLLSCLRVSGETPAASGEDLSPVEKIWIGLVCLGCLALIECSMLLSWTPVTYDYITGVQGRYFLPFFVLVLVLLRGRLITIRRNADRALLFAEGILDIVTVMQVLQYVMK